MNPHLGLAVDLHATPHGKNGSAQPRGEQGRQARHSFCILTVVMRSCFYFHRSPGKLPHLPLQLFSARPWIYWRSTRLCDPLSTAYRLQLVTRVRQKSNPWDEPSLADGSGMIPGWRTCFSKPRTTTSTRRNVRNFTSDIAHSPR